MCAETVAEAFDAMYYLEQAARITVKALSTGQKLKLVDEKVGCLPDMPTEVPVCAGGCVDQQLSSLPEVMKELTAEVHPGALMQERKSSQ